MNTTNWSDFGGRLAALIICILADCPTWVVAAGFSVNGGGQQTGTMVGAGSGNDTVMATGTFSGTYNQNPGNGGAWEAVTVNAGAIITPPVGWDSYVNGGNPSDTNQDFH